MATKKLFTLVFLQQKDSILLGYKTRGLGVGLWNGFGGKLEPQESIENCARRELQEECNLIAEDLQHLGVVKYEEDNKSEISIVHIFTSHKFQGNAMASEEMNPIQWYQHCDIPFEQMWPDAHSWYPFMLKGTFFSAHITYGNNGIITKSDVKERKTLNEALYLIT